MHDVATVVHALKSASTLTETTFLQISRTLESSMEILARLAARFELVLTELNGDGLTAALNALSRTIARLAAPDRVRANRGVTFNRLVTLSDAVAHRVARMSASLADVGVLGMNRS